MKDSSQQWAPDTRLLRWLLELPRRYKCAAFVLVDLLLVPACLAFAVTLRSGSVVAVWALPVWVYVLAAASAIVSFAAFGLYRAAIRFIGFRSLVAVLAGACAAAGAVWLAAGGALLAWTWSVAVIFGLNVLVAVSATRFLARWLLTVSAHAREPVVIYGAGEAGAQLTVSLNAGSRMRVVAYVDARRSLRGATVSGAQVIQPGELPAIVRDHGVKAVLLAMPSVSRARRAEIVRELAGLGVRVQTVPELAEIISGRASLDDIRDISVHDLLGRDPVAPDPRLLSENIHGRCVMVSGAGGSIGSELCRQILAERPARLVLYEVSELALYEIKRELDERAAGMETPPLITALLGNVTNRRRALDAMRAFGVESIYHAAAYKHVPIVEENIVQGVANNVLGTWCMAEAAIEAGVGSFVLISTDKAVNPTNVMGATKRFAELVLQAMQERQSTTRFCMVRFGNVLASSGSVVPLFQSQIRAGGPVTVTHPEVRRYFMTIPEAAALVLQAGSMSRGGEVFLLDMGQPVKIDELARRMIALSGLTVRDAAHPAGDIEIHYTGLRPAEKLYEELLIGENSSGTEHPMILQANEHFLPWPEVQALLGEVQALLEKVDCIAVRALLARAVREYRPAERVHDLVWVHDQTGEGREIAAGARHLRAVP
jgi:FlaA1/EpsC-like NDP-sugar epimerase